MKTNTDYYLLIVTFIALKYDAVVVSIISVM